MAVLLISVAIASTKIILDVIVLFSHLIQADCYAQALIPVKSRKLLIITNVSSFTEKTMNALSFQANRPYIVYVTEISVNKDFS